MKFIPRKLVCFLLVAGVCFATTEVGTAFGQKPDATPSPDKPSPSSSTPDSAAVPMPKEITSKSTGMKLALIPAGTFLMGSSDADVKAALQADSTFKEEYAKAEQPQHTVKISKPFYMGVYEVTQGEYESVMGTNPSWFSKTGDGKSEVRGLDTSTFPVEAVSWFDAVEFCNKLSAQDGLTAYYGLTNVTRESGSIKSATVSTTSGNGYRLPSEAEWEYACRGKTTTPFHFGSILNGDKANINGNYPYGTTTRGEDLERPTTVGSYVKNEFGLYDMHGNVWEWCFDVVDGSAYVKRGSGTTADPVVTSGSESRALRGGSWVGSAWIARTADRYSLAPALRNYCYGFRVVR
jgi:formylglycine-generating enzyme required for sulfatase activity